MVNVKMKSNHKSRFGLKSKLMGICFSVDGDKIPQEQRQLSSKGNQGIVLYKVNIFLVFVCVVCVCCLLISFFASIFIRHS